MVRLHLPSFEGATAWLNTEPLGPDELRGHVVLVDFWTLTCINWLRTEPYVRAWSQAYRDDGLIVIGVHTPEFSFEHEIDRVRLATKERDIDYPVARRQRLRGLERLRQPLLAGPLLRRHGTAASGTTTSAKAATSSRSAASSGCSVSSASSWPSKGLGVEAEADWDHLRTPETYLGYGRSEHFASPRREPAPPERLNHWALAGEWTVGRERVVLDQAGGSIAYRFHARDVHLVLSLGAGRADPVPGAPRRRRLRAHRTASTSTRTVNGVLRDGRLYQLVRQDGEVRERTVEITFLEPGAEAYVFTFG